MSERPKRKAIPDRIKLEVVLRQDGRCTHCGERLGTLAATEFDHRPSIINRDVNEAGTDYIPPQLDPEHIEAIHGVPCHRERTVGRGGDKRTTVAGSDIHIRDKTKRLVEKRLAREAAAENLIEPNSELPATRDIANSSKLAKIKSTRNSEIAKAPRRWPPKKVRPPYRRRGV